jgi:hypothetical protein
LILHSFSGKIKIICCKIEFKKGKKMQKAFLFLCVFILIAQSAFAIDTGKLITNECRANLKMLNEVTKKYLEENDSGLPAWSTYKNVKDMLIGVKYLPKDPVPPTRDCQYYLVSLGTHDFQWYCNLHGVIDGDKTITFNYHEHKIMAKTSSRYMQIEKYEKHTNDLLRWTEYNPTISEKLKYNYNKNPVTTVFIAVFVVMVIWFIYRNVFQ